MRDSHIKLTEESLIGGLLRSDKLYWDYFTDLKSKYFSSENCRKIFRLIQEDRNNMNAPDIIRYSDKLSIPVEFFKDFEKKWRDNPNPKIIDTLKKHWIKAQATGLFYDGAVSVEGGESPEDVAETFNRRFTDEILSDSVQETGLVKEAVREAFDEYHEAIANDGNAGISTGYNDLDYVLGGLYPGDQWILAGRTGLGKSTMALNILLNLAEQDIPTVFISLEMPRVRVVQIMAAILSGVSTLQIRKGELTADEDRRYNEALEKIHEMPIFILTKTRTIDSILSSLRYHQRKYGIKVVMLDYIQLVRGGQMSWKTTYRLGDYSTRLKAYANDSGIANIVIAQLNREQEKDKNRVPLLSDLKSSGSLEQDATAVLLMYKPTANNQYNSLYHLYIKKSRYSTNKKLYRLWVKRRFVETDGEPVEVVEETQTPF